MNQRPHRFETFTAGDGHPSIRVVEVTQDEWLAAQAEIERVRAVAKELYVHLKSLNEALYEERYRKPDRPCAGCYDAQYAYEALVGEAE